MTLSLTLVQRDMKGPAFIFGSSFVCQKHPRIREYFFSISCNKALAVALVSWAKTLNLVMETNQKVLLYYSKHGTSDIFCRGDVLAGHQCDKYSVNEC